MHQKARGTAVSSGALLRTEFSPSGASRGDLGVSGPPTGTFNSLPRDPLTVSEKFFYKYLLSDYDGTEITLALGWGWDWGELGNGPGETPNLTVSKRKGKNTG